MNFEIIDKRRAEQRYTVVDFCKAVGINRSTYYDYMRRPEAMAVSTLEKITSTLNLSAQDIQKILD